MTERGRRLAVLLGWCVVLAVLMQAPQFLRMLDDRYQGVLTALNSDESVYRSRVQEALNGRPEQSAEAFVGDPSLRGTQPAVLEAAIGTLFAPTGWRAPTVLQALDSVIPPLLFLAVVVFLGLSGMSRGAMFGGILFTLLQLYNLNRPIHQAGSALVVFAALNGILLGMRGAHWASVAGGILLGLLFGVGFWSWSFAWAWWGLMFLWCLCSARTHALRDPSVRALAMAAVAGVVTALPFLLQTLALSHDPLWSEAVFRSGMHPGRLPESWAYSALFTVMMVGVLWTFLRGKAPPHTGPLVVLVAASWIVIHQQIVHGQIFNFVSHYLMFMVVAAVGTVLLALTIRRPAAIVAGCAAAVYLLAIGYDGRFVMRQWNVDDGWGMQHLAGAYPALDALPRSRILSDPETSGFIAESTKHDVAYSVYLKNVLMSHREIAERFCLTQLLLAPEARDVTGGVVYPDAIGAFGPEIAAQEAALVDEACAAIDRDPAAALKRYGVTHVLQNAVAQPSGKISRLKVPFTLVAEGDKWTLWSVSDAR